MTSPTIIVFDIGNVLLDWSPAHLYRRLIPDDGLRAAFFARLPLDEMNLAGDRDGGLQTAVEAMAERYPEDAPLILAWWAGWERMCGGLIAESVVIRDAARRAGLGVWALSNFAADSWARCVRLYPELKEFDGLVISGDVKAVKPDPEIYEALERRAGRSGAELFLIDDRPANVEAARARGWGGHVFEGAAGAREALLAAGVEI
ncbi:HAD family phosphatase [Pikeienuella piscinae]|uniref:HAD family phosphatase n=1 Tax=Pikeienuella piscinae TaxID=2748098 RepID=A0A7L5BXC9_9RHOB|nr:HAD family phosphatase [Pikeienuella piscinae]QIE56091.1 HAD family phosphatase [Pikeienuella piscinae]